MKKNDSMLSDFIFGLNNLKADYIDKFRRYPKLALIFVVPLMTIRNIYIIATSFVAIPISHLLSKFFHFEECTDKK